MSADFFDHLRAAYIEDASPVTADIRTVDTFIDIARKRLRKNQPIAAATIPEGFGLVMQDGQQLPLVLAEEPKADGETFNSAAVTTPRGGGMQQGFSQDISETGK